jgi:putative hemolysin
MRIVGLLIVSFLMASCTVSGPDPIMGLQLPNPASVYCIERGGTLDIEESPQGDVSICVLSDGTRVDEWAFYRQNHPQR